MRADFATLGSVAEFINGAAFKPEDWGDEGKPIVRIQNLTDPTKPFNRTKRQVAEKLHVHFGDLLVSWSASLGVFEWRKPEIALLNQHIFRVLPDEARVDKRYLRYGLERALLDMQQHLHGATMQHVNRGEFLATKLYLPSLREQRRIAEILDKADMLRVKRRAALVKLDTLTQSIFLDMFGDPATNPKGWPVVSIEDICEVKGGKRLPKGEEYSSAPTPFRYIRVVDLKAGRVDESALVYLKPKIQAEIARYVVNMGDVIISIAGSIGLVAPVTVSLDGVNLTENAAKLVRRTSGQYEAEYLADFLKTGYAQGQIRSHIGQVTIGKLALFRIEKLKVPLPPMELQRAYIGHVGAVAALASEQRKGQSRLDELFAALQHRAFRGDL